MHSNCITDLKISNKKMKPLHYLAKHIRQHGVSEGERGIFEVLKKHKVYAIDSDEIQSVQRQMCRLASSQFNNDSEVEQNLKDLTNN